MDVESSLSMATCRIAEPAAVAAVEDLIPPSMETNSGDPCTLTDLSSCNAIPEDQPVSNVVSISPVYFFWHGMHLLYFCIPEHGWADLCFVSSKPVKDAS
ncbi:hypothetical protein Y032_0276g1094 [Ancylostoma ceylanicum]|uniref:Uncharacterized protein n=1 Tax=Ancylostoma ceylanicum TaxID=53326 RepID=A0A016S842_9BILA|nr:hypothetical protein Y032_0276g1094 [Ancylostoma ceylanicum]